MNDEHDTLYSVLLAGGVMLVSLVSPMAGGLVAVFGPLITGIPIEDDYGVFPELASLQYLSGINPAVGVGLVVLGTFALGLGLLLDLYDIVGDPYRRLHWLRAMPILIFLSAIRMVSTYRKHGLDHEVSRIPIQ